MPRKKPFSCKQKKQQLRENRLRKQDGPAYLADSSDGEENVASSGHRQEGGGDHASTAQTRQGQVLKIHQQPKLGDGSKLDANSFRLHFFKESDEVINRKRKEARKPVKPVGEQQLEYKLEDAYPPGAKLDFPKRPPWSYILTKEQLDQQEKQYFDTYVSDILDQPRIQDLSYFELNLETWRQLWRVLEISDILLIIADIRYPVLQVSPSLISHILQDLHKQVIIVLNKVDFVPPVIALAWKRYLHTVFPGIHVVFFSSFPREPVSEDDPVNFDPSKSLYKRKFQGKFVPVGPAQLLDVCKEIVGDRVDLSSWEEKLSDSSLAQTEEGKTTNQGTLKDPGSQTESSNEQQSYTKYKNGILSIGCIGYPNAGKSSVLNALVGRKVVSVSKTPGHTKHFQTIFLTPTVKLCDCPGLVFPSMVPKSLQVLAGIFPVAQVREPFSVVGYLAKRLDLPKLLRLAPLGSGYKGREWSWSAYDICDAWATKHGFTTSKAGRPDTYRAANKILRLAVEGQLCLCFRPPGFTEGCARLSSDPETVELARLFSSQPQTNLATSGREGCDSEEEEEEEESSDESESQGADEEEEEETVVVDEDQLRRNREILEKLHLQLGNIDGAAGGDSKPS